MPPDMANLLKKLTVAKDPLLDVTTSLLMGSTDVRGKDAGEKGKGFVPSDRLVLEEVSTCNVRGVVKYTSVDNQLCFARLISIFLIIMLLIIIFFEKTCML